LTAAYDLPRSRVLRWRANVRLGNLPIRRRGRAKPPPSALLLLVVYLQMAALRHQSARSPGLPSLCQEWSAIIPRAQLRRLASDYRLRRRRRARARLQRLHCPHAGTVWAMDAAVILGVRWLVVTDLASRYRFPLLLADQLPAQRIRPYLEQIFRLYTPPLVIKRDNGSNLDNPLVDDVLGAYGVLALNSPCRYPRYNGAVEYAQREIKTLVLILHRFAGLPIVEALERTPGILNTKPRPCLHGATADDVFHTPNPALAWAFTSQQRKESKHWIEQRTDAILATMTARNRRTQAAARRLATETRMRDLGLIAPVAPPKVLPH
jgi:hypothetical protein